MQPAVSFEALDSRDPLANRSAQRRDARPRRRPVDQHRAGPALALAAAVLAPGQIEIVAQNAEQTAIGLPIDLPASAINDQFRQHSPSF
jgi:hypothetical protein